MVDNCQPYQLFIAKGTSNTGVPDLSCRLHTRLTNYVTFHYVSIIDISW